MLGPQERKRAVADGLRIRRLTGADIKPAHWDAFHSFYMNTTNRKWGSAYLTREFWHQLGDRMADRVLLVVAESDKGECQAGTTPSAAVFVPGPGS